MPGEIIWSLFVFFADPWTRLGGLVAGGALEQNCGSEYNRIIGASWFVFCWVETSPKVVIYFLSRLVAARYYYAHWSRDGSVHHAQTTEVTSIFVFCQRSWRIDSNSHRLSCVSSHREVCASLVENTATRRKWRDQMCVGVLSRRSKYRWNIKGGQHQNKDHIRGNDLHAAEFVRDDAASFHRCTRADTSKVNFLFCTDRNSYILSNSRLPPGTQKWFRSWQLRFQAFAAK